MLHASIFLHLIYFMSTMNVQGLLEQAIQSYTRSPLTQEDLLNLILPAKNATYTLENIDEILERFHDEVETIQRKSNDDFDSVLDITAQDKLKRLSDNLTRTQEEILVLNSNIARARRQFQLVQDACNDRVVHERQDVLQTEMSLRRALQQSKFSSVKGFFERFVVHLEDAISACRKLLAQSSVVNYLQALDWGQYHQVMFLLRACGQAKIDLDRFEKLYQSHKDFFGLSFRQPLEKIDLNNFIEFHVTYSLETQLDVIVNSQGDRVEFGSFIREPKIEEILNSTDTINYELFTPLVERLNFICTECCRLLVDLHLNHIEAHLTDGINIDKLNGSDTALSVGARGEVMPSYAFAPQEYITQMGQHLMTLKKQTEKFDHIDNRPLLLALDYLKNVSAIPLDIRARTSVTERILEHIARQVIRSLVGRTASSVLTQLTANGKKQLATDAAYLNSVLEDLGLVNFSDPSVEKFRKLFSQH